MKRLLRILALVIFVVSAAIWAVRGANTGWTKDRVQETRIDEITGINHVVWHDTWLPGLDFLAAGLACSAGLLIASALIGRKKS